MPRSDFYAGLPLAEQLEKLVEHHHDPAVRHISQDEASIIYSAVARLKAGVTRAQRTQEFDAVWQRLEHLYETTIWSRSSDFQLVTSSLPIRSDKVPARPNDLIPKAWIMVEGAATPRLVQLALNIVFRRAIDSTVDVVHLWDDQALRRSPPDDRALGELENELLNRALYQPTIAVEQSPPVFSSISEILGKAAGPTWVALVAESTRDPVTVVVAGGVVILLSVSRTVVGGAAQGLSDGLKERLYEWSRPREHIDKGPAHKQNQREAKGKSGRSNTGT